MSKKEKTYLEICREYNPELRLKYFDRYRDSPRDYALSSAVKSTCYVIDKKKSNANAGVKHKIIEVNIESIERVGKDGEMLFKCTCNQNDFFVMANDEKTAKQHKKSFFHRLERMMVEVI